ncbi:hypothetical protein RAM80_12045 [Pseudomonas sp. App30]|uniref:hypothetical protein n=1 Tax=Pseudomonas sp. App30 TaxID=3068990 RepID=UPI003A7FF33E
MIYAQQSFGLDPAFGKQGMVVCDKTLLGDLVANSVYSMAVRADGSIVVATSDEHRQGGLLIALDKNGQPDGPSGHARYIHLEFEGHEFEEGVGVQELADGRLLFTAWLEGEGEALWVPGFAMVNADLSLDTSFGDQGFTVVPFDELRQARVASAAQAGARPAAQVGAVMGTAAHFVIPFVVNDEQTFVIRLLANGKLDTGYHGRGYQEIVYEGRECELPAATTLEDGRMLLAGRLTAGSQTLIVALTAQGEIDASFGKEGVALVDLPEARLLSIFQSPEHRLQVSGFLGNQGLLASLMPDGALDTQFNQGAPLYLRPDAARLRVERLETGLDGLICGVGQDHALNLVESKGVLTCHGLDGAPHPAFGPQGTLFVDKSFGFWDLKLQRGDKWLVAGSHSPSRAGLVCRYMHASR